MRRQNRPQIIAPKDSRFGDTRVFVGAGEGNIGDQIFIDRSPYRRIVTAAGNSQIGQGLYDKHSILLDGVGDYLTIPNDSFLDFSGDFLFEADFNLTADSSTDTDGNRGACLFSTYGASLVGLNGYALQLNGNSSTTGTGFLFDHWVSGTLNRVFNFIFTVTKNVNHRIAVERINGVNYLWYDDSYLTSTAYGTALSSGGNPMRIGGVALTGYSQTFTGKMGTVRLSTGYRTINDDKVKTYRPFPTR